MTSVEKARDIIDAWSKYFSKKPDSKVEEIAAERAEICSGCRYIGKSKIITIFLPDTIKKIQGYRCTACGGCPLSSKVRVARKDWCKAGKWKR